jgi:CheY-like chemotaxis protein
VSVLVVEDEPDAREVVGALLEARGAEVELTASVAEAYQSLAEHRPHVIVSDIGMPGVDGFEFARGLRALSPERGGDTPIVALTAFTSAQDRRRSLEAGYDCHLAKPINMDELVRVLQRLSKHAPAS